MLNLEQLVLGFAVSGLRISGLLLFAPFYGSASMPGRIKVGLAILLMWLLYPLGIAPKPAIATPGEFAVVASSELMLGLLLGLSVQFVFEASQLAGQILGVQLGFSLVHVLDPQTQADTPVFGLLQQTIVMLLFLALDVPNWMLRGLAHSFAYVPPGETVLNSAVVGALMHEAGYQFFAGVQIAAPALAATMLADLALGFLGKASPQLPVLFVGLSVKSVLGLLVMTAAIVSWPRWFEHAFAGAVEHGERLLHLAH
ncbi:MAG: flagellar biosynthetic protein FliR [Terriglobia bacterium]|nr:flagellar biosynthetic protein FliR [Terriglobia bacterium]